MAHHVRLGPLSATTGAKHVDWPCENAQPLKFTRHRFAARSRARFKPIGTRKMAVKNKVLRQRTIIFQRRSMTQANTHNSPPFQSTPSESLKRARMRAIKSHAAQARAIWSCVVRARHIDIRLQARHMDKRCTGAPCEQTLCNSLLGGFTSNAKANQLPYVRNSQHHFRPARRQGVCPQKTAKQELAIEYNSVNIGGRRPKARGNFQRVSRGIPKGGIPRGF